MGKIEINGKLYYSIIFLLIIILLSGIASAVPPVTQQFTTGFNIKVPEIDVLKVNQDYEFEFHVFNISNGMPVNSGITCYFHLYNSSGEHLFNSSDSTSDTAFDYGFLVLGHNFSTVGSYYYNIQCNNTQLGGYQGNNFNVNMEGKTYNSIDGALYSIMFLLLIIIFGLCSYGAMMIPYTNENNGDGIVYKINWKKYLKVFLWGMTYLCAIGITFLAWNISFNVLNYLGMANFFYVFYHLLLTLAIPVFIVAITITIITYVHDMKLLKLMERGLTAK